MMILRALLEIICEINCISKCPFSENYDKLEQISLIVESW